MVAGGHKKAAEFQMDVLPDFVTDKKYRIIKENETTWSCKYDHTEAVKLLLDHGADPNIKDSEGWTGLMRASRYGHIEIVKLLLDYGTDPTIENDEGKTAIEYAQENGHKEIVELLYNPKSLHKLI